jgi:hypothetical protein
MDRTGQQWWVVDVDGTRAIAGPRALPQMESLPAPHRRFEAVCAPGYQGRKRGEVVRTRTVILQAHTHQFLGTFGGPGNGDYRGELVWAIEVIKDYVCNTAWASYRFGAASSRRPLWRCRSAYRCLHC